MHQGLIIALAITFCKSLSLLPEDKWEGLSSQPCLAKINESKKLLSHTITKSILTLNFLMVSSDHAGPDTLLSEGKVILRVTDETTCSGQSS